ncbi:oligopeptidase A, partial [Pseudomonas canadensis]|nr:oligopeptidase A [Pseudomonas canadensis]
MSENNPLLQRYDLPPFSAIRAEHLIPAVQAIIAESRVMTTEIIASQKSFPTWDDLVLAVDELEARLDGTLTILQLLGSTRIAPVWQEAITRCQELAEQYKSEQAQNSELYQLYRRLADSPIAALFNEERKRALHKILRKYHLAGLDLSSEQQLQLTSLNMEISKFQFEFLARVEDSNTAWSKHIED